jgi:hypothetical protein
MVTSCLVLYCGCIHFEIWPNYRVHYLRYWTFSLSTPPTMAPQTLEIRHTCIFPDLSTYNWCWNVNLLTFVTEMTFLNNQQFNRSICLVVRGRAISNRCSHINYTRISCFPDRFACSDWTMFHILVLFVSTAVDGTEADQRGSSWPRHWVVQLQQQQQGAVEGSKAAHSTSASRGRWGPCVQGPQTKR